MKRLLTTVVSLMILNCIASSAYAAGYAILEQSGIGSGDAYSGAVVGYGDGSEAFFNPAAMTKLEDTNFAWQVSMIKLRVSYRDKGSIDSQGNPLLGNPSDGGDLMALPSAYFAKALSDDLTFGFAFNTPYGFVIDYDKDWIGRYRADESNVRVISFTPSLAYEVSPNLSLGASFGVSYVEATLSNSIDFGGLAAQRLGAMKAAALGLGPQTADGYVELHGDDWTTNMGLSALYSYGKNERNKVGLSWRGRIVSDINANADFDMPASAASFQEQGLFVDTKAKAHFTLPEIITFGTQYWLTDRWAIQAESAWTNWHRFKELRIRFDSNQPDSVEKENWHDTWRYSVGTLYKLTDALTVRGGWAYDQSAVYDDYRTPRVPDQSRNWMSFGLTYAINETIELYASYSYLFVHMATSDIGDNYGNRIIGQYDLTVQLMSFGMSAKF